MANEFINLSRIESILNQRLGPLYCQCRRLKDATLLICVYEPINNICCLMVAGITAYSCRNDAGVEKLADSIQADLAAVRSVG